jgi:hypothetical protein
VITHSDPAGSFVTQSVVCKSVERDTLCAVRSASSSLTEADVPRTASGNCALSARATGVERNVMAAPNIGHSVIRIVNIFVVVILILILLNLLGQPISNAIPSAAQNTRDIIDGLWNGIKDIVPNNWNNYFYHHH